MIFNITFGASVSSAPEGFKTTVAAVAQFFQDTFTDPVTVNVKVDFTPLHGLLGHSDYSLNPSSYAQITGALAKDTSSASDAGAVASLPATDPISGTHSYFMTTAQAKALGLAGASGASDGTVTLASDQAFDYDRSDGITAGQYDFYGSVAHEFSEVMGRELNAIGNHVQFGEPHGYYPEDLFKFTAAGERTFVGTKAGYFSPDGGVTNLNHFNTDADDDFGDWAQSAGHDSFLAFSDSGVVNAVTAADVLVMDVLGWDASGAIAALADAASVGGGGGGGSGRGDPGHFALLHDAARHSAPLISDEAPPGHHADSGHHDARDDLASAATWGHGGSDWLLI
jgi:hypothetical protein